MIRVLWIVNKYIEFNDYEMYFVSFLKQLQVEMEKLGIEIHFVFFSDNLKKQTSFSNTHFFSDSRYTAKVYENMQQEGWRIEREYGFTFKQAYFSDLIQTEDNPRTISVDEASFDDNLHLVRHFEYLEDFVISKSIDVIFSDVSPEAEMEFGRVIGQKLGKIVIKDYEGGFLGKSIFLHLSSFGKDEVVDATLCKGLDFEAAEKLINDHVEKQLKPYEYPKYNITQYTLGKKVTQNLKQFQLRRVIRKLLKTIVRKTRDLYFVLEHKYIKKIYLDKFDNTTPYIFFGLQLNQESTMVLRSQPFVNQVVLIEMISRVLPLGYTLYVREHPHWSTTYSLKYLLEFRRLNNVKLISTTISIHEVIKKSRGVITYNSTTGIEALMHGKPVLSFASNVYYRRHPGVDYCGDLYDLGSCLTKLVNQTIDKNDTIKYIMRMSEVSHDISLSSYVFHSEKDAQEKAEKFARYLRDAVTFLYNNSRQPV